MQRPAILIILALSVMCFNGCGSDPPDKVVGNYIQSLMETKLLNAAGLCTGDARGLTVKKIGRG